LARFIIRAPDTHAFQQVDVAQAALVASWRTLLQGGQILPFDSVGFQTYSENEEDGILLYIFTVAGTTNKIVVEISSQDGQEAEPSFARAKSIVADEIRNRSKRQRPPNWVRSAKMMSRSTPSWLRCAWSGGRLGSVASADMISCLPPFWLRRAVV
jgi:hypothetical protein